MGQKQGRTINKGEIYVQAPQETLIMRRVSARPIPF
jgi:hypothetical protein